MVTATCLQQSAIDESSPKPKLPNAGLICWACVLRKSRGEKIQLETARALHKFRDERDQRPCRLCHSTSAICYHHQNCYAEAKLNSLGALASLTLANKSMRSTDFDWHRLQSFWSQGLGYHSLARRIRNSTRVQADRHTGKHACVR